MTQTQTPSATMTNTPTPQTESTGRKVLSTVQFAVLAVMVSTVFIAIFLWVMDNSAVAQQFDWNITVNGEPLGNGDLDILVALLVGVIFSVLPIFLFLVFTATSMIMLGGIAVTMIAVAVAFALPAGIMAMPLILLAGIVWLVRRNHKGNSGV